MAKYNLSEYDFSKHGFTMPLNVARANAFPLDKSSVWKTYEEALNYAKTDPVAYVGQIVTVVNYTEAVEEVKEGETVVTPAIPAHAEVDVYKIELDSEGVGTLVKVGSSEEVGALDTKVSGIQTELAQTKTDLGTVTTKVGTIETDLGTAKNDIDKVEETVGQHTESIGGLSTDVEQLKTDVGEVEELAGSNKTRLDQYDIDKANYASKGEVATAKTEAIAAAKTETQNQISAVVSQYLTGDGAQDTIDTLQEIVDWLNTEGSGASKIVADIETIQADYLKGADKTELNNAITNLSNFVGSLPQGVTSTTVIGYIQEVVDGLKIGDYAKAEDLSKLTERVSTLEGKVKTFEEATIPGINTAVDGLNTRIVELEKVDHSHENGTILDAINQSKVDGWDEAASKAHSHDNGSVLNAITAEKVEAWDGVSSKASQADLTALTSRVSANETAITTTLPGEIANKVTQTYTDVDGKPVANRLITPSEAQKLEKLILNADGSVTTGQTVAAGDVQGLADWITNNGPTHIKNLGKSNLSDELVTLLESSISNITVNGKVLAKTNGQVDIPLATNTAHGTVLLGAEFKVDTESGAMEINNVNVNKLTQTTGEVLELYGGNAAGDYTDI